MHTVTDLKVVTNKATNKKPTKAAATRERKADLKLQRYASYVPAALVMFMLAVSLNHQVKAIEMLTRAELWNAWCMAVAYELMYVACAMALLVTVDKTALKQLTWVAKALEYTCLLVSAFMNSVAFIQPNETIWRDFECIALGCFITFTIWAGSEIATKLWLTSRR